MMSGGPPPVSLVKYGKPEVTSGVMAAMKIKAADKEQQEVEEALGGCGSVKDPALLQLMLHTCKEAALTKIDKHQILDAIVPPREWDEDGKKYQQLISKDPATRFDVSALTKNLNEQLTMRQARPDAICPIRRELADQCFDELIRQITLEQPERGLLLLRVRDELRMTLQAYQDLFVSVRNHDPRETVAKDIVLIRDDINARYLVIKEVVDKLEKEREDLQREFENKEVMLREAREMGDRRHHEEFQFLKRINNTLKQQIEAMNDPFDDYDPVIANYECIAQHYTRGNYKFVRPCKQPEEGEGEEVPVNVADILNESKARLSVIESKARLSVIESKAKIISN